MKKKIGEGYNKSIVKSWNTTTQKIQEKFFKEYDYKLSIWINFQINSFGK